MLVPELKELTLEIYTYLYTGVLDRSINKINLAQNGQGTILSNFCDRIYRKFGDSIGTDWLVDYCIFQIHYWYDKETSHKVTMGWVFGDKALQRFLNKPQGKSFYEDKFLKARLKTTREKLRKKWAKTTQAHPLEGYKSLPHEQAVKRKFLNTEFGFFQCQTLTSLYSKDDICHLCKFQEECKKLLKKSFPELARVRGIQ